MTTNMKYLLLLSCFSILCLTAQGLECYQCQTLGSDVCDDPFNPNNRAAADTLGECDEGSYCVKYKTVIKLRDSGYINGWERHSVTITRACEPRDGKSQQCTGWQNNGGITIKCWCGSDGCNSGHSLVPSQRVFSVISFLSVVLALARKIL